MALQNIKVFNIYVHQTIGLILLVTHLEIFMCNRMYCNVRYNVYVS
jgi:hypothetical protein